VNNAESKSKRPIDIYRSRFKYIFIKRAPPNKSAVIRMKIFNKSDRIDRIIRILSPPKRFLIYSGIVYTLALLEYNNFNSIF
jgi:hypothetical protein